MMDFAGFSVHDLFGSSDFAAERFADRLHSQAHPKNRQFARKFQDERLDLAGFVRSPWSGAQNDAFRLHPADELRVHFIVSLDDHIGSKFLHVLHDVISERIVIVNNKITHENPLWAISTAKKTPSALLRHSCHSFSGTESYTIPAPAWM